MHDFAHNADDDRELLARFAGGDEAAFGALVERYSGLVYGTAMRRLADQEWAGDATQNVFAALATKAPALVRQNIPSVGAWLHRAATFESKRVLRDRMNQQRREAMIREELTKVSGDDVVWNDIRPELDEALQKLSGRDRDVLMLHYFDGLKFKEVAVRLGMSSDAAQKRGKRALEKLARLLGTRRGAAVSSAVLAAGLAPELAQAAPPALVAKLITTKATAAASATGGAAIITAMSTATKTVSTVAAALAVLAASVGTGYLIGDTTREKSPLSNTAQVLQLASPESAGGGAASLSASAQEPAAGATPLQQFLAQVEGMMGERMKLMMEGKRLQQSGATEEALDEVFAKLEALEQRAYASADALEPEDLEKALAHFENTGEAQIAHIGQRLVLSAWAKRDPMAALELANTPERDRVAYAFHGWGMTDPTAALQKQKEIAEQERGRGRNALTGLYEGWLAVNPSAAISALEEMSFDDQKALHRVFGHLTRRPSTRGALLDAIARVADEKLRADLVREAGGDWAEYAPRQTFAWFDTIEFENTRLTIPALNIIFNSAIKNGEWGEASDWMWRHLPADQKPHFISQQIIGSWSNGDPESAAAWMAKHGIEQGAEEGEDHHER